MHIYEKFKQKENFTEVIYGALDSYIHFYDLETGECTRDKIKIPSCIKGSVTVDPRGYPLLYVGQGIDTNSGEAVKMGYFIFSLIDGKELCFINGRDKFSYIGWGAFDGNPVIDAKTDTMFLPGENGVIYVVKLNTNFITYLGTTWANKIATTTWKVGGNTHVNIAMTIPSVAYQNEIVNPDATNSTDNATEYQAKIGLMYVSDYGFAASPSAWTKELYYYWQEDITSKNWMYMGFPEWTISRWSDYSYSVFNVGSAGDLGNSLTVPSRYAGRASFNLVSSITYKSGLGTMSDPIIIN